MAINVSPEKLKDKEGLKILFDNGDLEALKKALQKWNFKDEASLIRFVLSLLISAEDNKIWLKFGSEQKEATPVKELLRYTEENGN